MSAPSIKRFADRGFLHRIYRGVYSLGLAVEIDGPGHAEIARLTVDRTREMALRQAGIDLIRYSPRQIAEEAKAVADEIARELAGRRSVSEL